MITIVPRLLTLLALALPNAAHADPIVVTPGSDGAHGVERHLRFLYEVTNPTADPIPAGARLLAFVPARRTATQTLLWVDASRPATLSADALGNTWVQVELPLVPPRGTVPITVTAAVAISASPHPSANDDGPAALSPEPFIESDDPAIVALARTLPTATARAVHAVVRAKVRATDYEPRDLGAVHALAAGRGDCTEMAYLAIALARAAGLPARLAGGWVAAVNAILSPARYHNWAEIHDGARWRAVDPQAASFDHDPSPYVATHLGGVGRDGPLSGYHRFRVDHPALLARMLEAP